MNTDILLTIESSRLSLHSELSRNTSARHKVFALQNFIKLLFASNNSLLVESYLPEFIDAYKRLLDLFLPEGIDIKITDSIIEQIKTILQIQSLKNITSDLENSLHSLQEKTLIIKNALDGIESDDSTRKRFIFPLLSKNNDNENNIDGYLDTITLHLKPVNTSQKFFTIPDEIEKDELLTTQLNNSWQAAKSFVQSKVKKDNQNFEVFIHFNGSYGVYRGSSLGVVLTLCFIEELLKFYNSNTVARTANSMVFTGPMDGAGKINSVSAEIIKAKTAAVFYSRAKMFVVPFDDYPAAKQKLDELKTLYPNRNLELIPVTNLEDILNRRNIVEIKKLTPVQRSGRFVKHNWAGILTAILLTVLLSYFFVLDFDDNPASVSADGQYIFVKNNNGKLLWKRHLRLDELSVGNENYLSKFSKLIDVNSDGTSEVLIANEQIGKNGEFNTTCALRCYDKYQNLLWKFSFQEKVSSLREDLESMYTIYMIDTLMIGKNNSLFLFANNGNSFSSAVFAIDLTTQKINTGILWSSGHTYDGKIRDINNDGKKDILCIGLDNGFEDAIFFGFNLTGVNCIRPTTDNYQIKNYPVSDFICLIRIPKTDYDFAVQNRFQSIHMGTLNYLSNTKEYFFIIDSDMKNSFSGIWYKLTQNLIDFNISVDNQFRVKRDSLVAKGILNLPYSDTKEYENILKNNILYWKNGIWVKKEEME
ncbi:MAG: hypothetical protein IPH11_19320 [Ignavibacteriales bacterium]|nr:hypothetical protein [Ignavibacteriales bacterium]